MGPVWAVRECSATVQSSGQSEKYPNSIHGTAVHATKQNKHDTENWGGGWRLSDALCMREKRREGGVVVVCLWMRFLLR